MWTHNNTDRELYNRTADPDENVNIVHQKGLEEEVERLSDMLHAGWRRL